MALGEMLFQSTPSGRKATVVVKVLIDRIGVSIHAFREEGDLTETVW